VKKFLLILVLLSLAFISSPKTALASTLNKVVFVVGCKDYSVNGSVYQMNETPYVEKGRLLAPYKNTAQALGIDDKDVFWDPRKNTVEIRIPYQNLKFTVGDKIFYCGGESQQMDVAPSIREGQLYLPVKWLAEVLGYSVGWDATSLSVLMGPPGDLPGWKPFPTTTLNSKVRSCEFSGTALFELKLLSASSIVFVGEYANVYNAGIAAQYVNGYVLEPGKVFSFDEAVGERDAERGFIYGYDILENLTIGGGVCRTSTVLYQAACGAKLEIIERYPHYLPVHYTPEGTDATVNWGTMDLRFRNTIANPIVIKAGLEEREKNRRLWTEFWERIPLRKVEIAVLRKDPGADFRENLETVQLTALVKGDISYVSLEQLSDLLKLPLEIREEGGARQAVLGLNSSRSIIFTENTKEALVNDSEFKLAGSPVWLPESNCKFWVPLRDWAKIIGGDVHWIAGGRPVIILNLSGKTLTAGPGER
jgi:hypothetical protein